MKVKVTCECEYEPDKKPIGVELEMVLEEDDIDVLFRRLGVVFGEKLKEKLEELKV